MAHPSLFFVVGADDNPTAVPQLLASGNVGYKTVNVDCITVNLTSKRIDDDANNRKINKSLDGDQTDIRDSVGCVVIGGRKGRAWSNATLLEYMNEREVYTRISNAVSVTH